ncbi:MAG: cellulase family glycosylhydrolase, partial [Fibrobacter sp.]|nr:cellulase family glycosylhydrolase [Fibrobacter sp.]
YHFGSAPSYTIDKEWLDRVEEVINYVLDNSMYAILNSHHDEWVTLTPSTQNEVTDKITKIWAQIADRFKDYSDYLIFETLNEPRLYGTQYEWTGGTKEARTILNAYNLAIVNTIRASGGNNAKRHIMIPTHGAAAMDNVQSDLVIPNNDPRIIVSQHTYWPYNFTMNTGDGATTSWGSEKDQKECIEELDRIETKFVKKGIPVVIGEWGSIERSNTEARAFHAEFYAREVRKRKMLPVWWDNGYEGREGFALLSRKTLEWKFPSIADGLIRGVNDGTAICPKNRISNNFNRAKLNFVSGKVFYSLSKPSPVTLNVYDIMGKSVYNMETFNSQAGTHFVLLPSGNLSSGKYIFQLKTNAFAVSEKIVITK